jgi:MFS transporter, FHS family, L-fucose permease
MDSSHSSVSSPSQPAAPIVEPQYRLVFLLVASLFFSWALAASLNDVLIRQFQKALDVTRTGSSLIQFAFYIGYFCAALPAGALIRRFGYKPTILFGLSLYAVGAFLFYPAAEIQMLWAFLVALYVIAIGLACLETAANPYISILGAPATSSARLNLAQSFYGLGAILGPAVGGLFIFSGVEHSAAELAAMTPDALRAYREQEASAVQGPYLALGAAVVLLAVVIASVRFPPLAAAARTGLKQRSMFSVWRHRQLRWAVVAQFFYVGAQVGIWSFFIDFTREQTPDLSERTGAWLLSGSLAMLLLGRFSGAFIQQRVAPQRLLALYALANIGLCVVAATSANGPIAVGALWLTSFFMSIHFPTIFAMGVANLGEETEAGASFLIMSIIGGALIPPLMGLLSDQLGSVQIMMLVPAACFGSCLWFALTTMNAQRTARA